jgi:putative addiction module component (TIGR02574 family)
MGLAEADRAELVESLIASLNPVNAAPLDDAWLAEIDRRSQEYDAGTVKAVPWSQVRERARPRLRRDV